MTQSQHSPDPSVQLRAELVGLPIQEILTLAYRFKQQPRRLFFYLDVLRAHGGQRAALAASLVCFDLASQGQESAQREFEALAATLRAFDARASVAADLIEGSAYLRELWPRCQQALDGLDPRTSAQDSLAVDEGDIVELDLFDDDELSDFDDLLVESFDLEAMRARRDKVLADFFGAGPDRAQREQGYGFFARSRADVERVEGLLRELDSLREPLPQVRGLLSLGQLFLASHLRSRSFWGKPNPRRIELTHSGLSHFFAAGESLFTAAAYFLGRDVEDDAWEKILQVLLDFAAWQVGKKFASPEVMIRAYADEARQLPRLRLDDRRLGAR